MAHRGSNDFREPIRRALALRAGYRCSFGGCRRATVGPSEESSIAVTNIGVAAHICAASPEGPRFVESMTPEERSNIANAIWLCSDHAALIDRDVTTYTIGYLREAKRNHERACAEAVRLRSQEPVEKNDLVAIGPDIIGTGELIARTAMGWSVELKHFVRGDFASLVAFVDGFDQSAPSERYVLVNALDDGRVLLHAPTITKSEEGYRVECAVSTSAPRIDAQRLGSTFAVSSETKDLSLDGTGRIARVAGVEALPQLVRSCLSMQMGESLLLDGVGVRIAEYLAAFQGTPWIERMIKLETIRQASIPITDPLRQTSFTPLQCVERVRSVQVLAGAPEEQWLPIRVDFDVRGVGRWQHDLSICIPSADALAKIRERQRMHLQLGFTSAS